MCFVRIWEQTAIISLYTTNWLVFIIETESVYCAVRNEYLNIIEECRFRLRAPVNIIPPTLHNSLHLDGAFNRTTNGRRLRTLQKAMVFPKWRNQLPAKYFHFMSVELRWNRNIGYTKSCKVLTVVFNTPEYLQQLLVASSGFLTNLDSWFLLNMSMEGKWSAETLCF